MYSGKRSKRFRVPAQVNADPEMLLAMEHDAALNRREPGAEVIFLIEMGLEHLQHCGVNAREVNRTHSNSRSRTLTHNHSQQLPFEPMKADGIEQKKRTA